MSKASPAKYENLSVANATLDAAEDALFEVSRQRDTAEAKLGELAEEYRLFRMSAREELAKLQAKVEEQEAALEKAGDVIRILRSEPLVMR